MTKRQLKAGDLVWIPPKRGGRQVGFVQGIFLRNIGKALFNDDDYICHVFSQGEKVVTVNSQLKLMDEHGNLLPWKTS